MMDDLAFQDEGIDPDEYGEDYYESQPGSEISSIPLMRNRRKYVGFGLVTFGVILVFGGIIAALVGSESEKPGGIQSDTPIKYPPGDEKPPLSIPLDPPTPPPVEEPVESPVEPPTDPPVPSPTDSPTLNEVSGTPAPSHSSAFSLLASLIGEDILLDADSLPYAAFNWLQDNNDLSSYDSTRIKQRFALASLYLATTSEDASWSSSEGWMTDGNECDWEGVTCQDNFLIGLNLTANGLEGNIPFEISLLSDTLLALKLSRNSLANKYGELAWIGELTKLRLLEIDETFFQYDGIPTYIKKLTDLRVLDVSNTLFYGELDGSIFQPLHKLLYLELGGNVYNSTLPQEIVQLPELEALYVYDVGLEGDLEFVSDLGPMYELWVDDNPQIVGTIPSSIGSLTTLASLSLSNCNLSGQIPSELGLLTDMEQMWLFGNWFSGTVPTDIGNLDKLQILAIEDNNITDVAMPSEVCALDLYAASADCNDNWGFTCDCCTCCEAPCPVATLPLYGSRNDPSRFLF